MHPPSDLHFRLKIKSCTRKRKKKAKRKKEKKKRLLTFDAELTRSVFSLYFFVPRYWCERRTRGRVRGGASYFLPVAA